MHLTVGSCTNHISRYICRQRSSFQEMEAYSLFVNLRKEMQSSSEQPLVGEERYVMTRIAAAKETNVQATNLRVHLVVLSCRHSGQSRILKGEGVVDIAFAFLAAGARSVLVTMWARDEEATMIFMKSFDQHLNEILPVGTQDLKNTGLLITMLPFERTFHKDLKTEKNSEISLSAQKISSLEI